MTIEAWNILLNSVILVLMVSGGLWLKHIVEQQLKAKDTAIQALEGVVKFKDAHIASLQNDRAPAIAESYAAMRKHANQITEDYQNLVAMYNQITSKEQFAAQLAPANLVLNKALGLNIASDILEKHMSELFFPDGKINPLFSKDEEGFVGVIAEAVFDAGREIASESRKCSKQAIQIMLPIKESLKAG